MKCIVGLRIWQFCQLHKLNLLPRCGSNYDLLIILFILNMLFWKPIWFGRVKIFAVANLRPLVQRVGYVANFNINELVGTMSTKLGNRGAGYNTVTYLHRMTPSFKDSWKPPGKGCPVVLVMNSIASFSSAGSYFASF